MPTLNWDAFRNLPGSAEKNFESLCRGIIRYNFGSYGVLRALANQPGVEFHLKLERKCDVLGDMGRWWGWQCKWYDLSANGALGSTRKTKIKDAIRKTEKHVPGVTDWVLWTRRPLTRADQEWFEGLTSTMDLHPWTEEDIDSFLVGQASVLRDTYFGDLVLTPDSLRDLHEAAVAPIRARWQPDVHQVVDAECDICRMLGEAGSWQRLRVLATDLCSLAQAVDAGPEVPAPLVSPVEDAVEAAKISADVLERVADGIDGGDIDLLHDYLSSKPKALSPSVTTAPRRLRSKNHRAGLFVINIIAGCRETLQLLAKVEAAFSSRIVGVTAQAGCGKTQLAAQLTVATEVRPHGVLLHGRDLHATHTLNDLAQKVSIAAQPAQSMESLLAAVDAAGQRARRRLPVVIDGLNESEDPRTWKPLLAALETTLAKYPYVLLVCTLRTEFVDEALPDETKCVNISEYEGDMSDAIRDHFCYWKINALDARLPGYLRHPLTLRLFCEVTNPKRQEMVGIDAMLGSLTALFNRYLDQAGDRIAELSSRAQRYYPRDVREAMIVIGKSLWESRSRSIGINDLRCALGDKERSWDKSLVRTLEHEGILLRTGSDGGGVYAPMYDRLGGHIIANALLTSLVQTDCETWICKPATAKLLAGDYNDQHPLADDIVHALVGQIPRRFHSKQLWRMLKIPPRCNAFEYIVKLFGWRSPTNILSPLRSRALLYAARLEGKYLDTGTVDALIKLARQGDARLLKLFREVRGTENHPLNAEALGQALRPMKVADRDLRWTEWIRRNSNEILRDLEELERRWRQRGLHAGDQLRAHWVMWTLTSTVRKLRDQATRTLYWFGRSDPEGLFDLTLDSLEVNDIYVGERMLAASYGVVMSNQQEDVDFRGHLKPFLEGLASRLVTPSVSAATTHYMVRLYVRGIIAFAEKFYASTIPNSFQGNWAFAAPASINPIKENDVCADQVMYTIQTDFENYTIGKLFEDRRNYDMRHKGHQAAVAHVRGYIWKLGWRASTMEAIDRIIAEDAYTSRGHRPSAERYGKKYGWIGFFTYAGMLEEQKLLPYKGERLSDVDLDVSFPDEPPTDGVANASPAWLDPGIQSHEQWFCKGSTPAIKGLLVREKIAEHQGPWVAVYGYVKASDRGLGREAWAFLSALVTPKEGLPSLMDALNSGERLSGPRDVPSDYYTYAGEIPWHPDFAAECTYRKDVHTDSDNVNVEVLAHEYAWESYHSEINQVGGVYVSSKCFSTHFDLRTVSRGFDQCLPDGTRATIALSGVDGLEGDVLYVREELLRQYVNDRAIVWLAFGERMLLSYGLPQQQWIIDAMQQNANTWQVVMTDEDLTSA